MKKTLAKLLTDPRVDEISDESRSGMFADNDGYWVYLSPGWQCGNEVPSDDAPVTHPDGTVTGGMCNNLHIVHEWTMRDLVRVMRSGVFRCGCWDCKARAQKSS